MKASLPLPKFTIGQKVRVADFVLTISSMEYESDPGIWVYGVEEIEDKFTEDFIKEL